MKYVRVGASGLRVGRIAVGTMNLATIVGEEESFAILDRAVDAGVNLVDTADIYGAPPMGERAGLTESLIGRWLATRRNRDTIVLATKAYEPTGSGPNDRGLSALHIRAAVEASLRRLGTDRIDLFQMHHVDRETPVDEILEALTILREQGKIVYAGSSNFAGWNLAQFQERARVTGRPALVSEQSVYNLAQRAIEREVVPAAEHYGIGLLPYSPLGGGLLAGILSRTDRRRSADHPRLERHRQAVVQYESLAREIGVPPARLALAWLIGRPAVTSAVVGPRTAAQLDDAVASLDVELSDDILSRLDSIWPGPGLAPEAYAW